MSEAVKPLRDAQKALEEALGLTPEAARVGRAYGLMVRALADVGEALAALSPVEITDARETG